MSGDRARSIGVLYVGGDSADEDEFRRALERRDEFSVVRSVGSAAEHYGVGDGIDCEVYDGVDCVVCDHRDGVDGVAILERVREIDPALPFVLLAPDDGVIASRAVSAGVSEYVPKTAEGATSILLDRVLAAVDAAEARGDEREGPADGEASRGEGRTRMPIADLGLREEFRLKERAMEEAPVGITISDAGEPDNPLIYLNDAFEALTGYGKRETVGRNCRFLQGDESDPNSVAAMREAIDAGEPVSVELVNYRKDGERFWNRVDVAPIRDEADRITNYVGFQTDVTARKEAELAVDRERRRLDHLLDRINGILQDVLDDLVHATSRERVERAVCERIAAADAYAFCWIGRPDLSRSRLVADTWAGEWHPDPGDLDVELPADSTDASPVAAAYATENVRAVADPDELAALVEDAPWIETDALRGMAALPLVYGETCYGVLAVYATEDDALNARELVVLEALGHTAATALNALERERIIVADEVIELEFEIRDRGLFFVDVSARFGDVEYEGSIYREDGSTLMFFTVDADPSAITESVRGYPDVDAVSLVHERDGGSLFEFTVGARSILATLAERGAKTRSMSATEGVGRVSVDLPSESEARAIVEALRERYPTTELVAHRERERPPEKKGEFVGRLTDSLTERQLTALQTAYVSGFYEWKRPVSGDDLADTMGIARSTFHQHLRAAERKVIGQIFEAQ
ncbi:MAG: bacterio-opsin activator domain-containing protein [Salinigranum sp.]